jgi:hypothetical protein
MTVSFTDRLNGEQKLLLVAFAAIPANFATVMQIYPAHFVIFVALFWAVMRFFRTYRIDVRLIALFTIYPCIVALDYFVSGTGHGVGLFFENVFRFFLFLSSFIIYGNIIDKNRFSDRLRFLVVTGIIVTTYPYLLVWNIFFVSSPGGRDYNIFAGYNCANIFFLSITIYLLSLFLRARSSARFGFLLFVAIELLLTLTLLAKSASREGLVVMIIGCLAFIFTSRTSVKTLLVVSAVLCSFLLFGSAVMIHRFVTELSALDSPTSDSSTLDRLWLMLQWYDRLSPSMLIFGDTWGLCYPQLAAIGGGGDLDCETSIHDGYLQMVAVGGLLFFAFMLWMTAGTLRRWCKGSPEFLSFMIAYAVGLLMSDNLSSTQLYILLPLAHFLLPPRGPSDPLRRPRPVLAAERQNAVGMMN